MKKATMKKNRKKKGQINGITGQL